MMSQAVVCVVWMHFMTQAIGLTTQNKLHIPYYHESMQRFKPPDGAEVRRNDSYFGFGLTYDNYCKSLVISSPRYDNIGKVYDCDITKETCAPLGVLEAEISREDLEKYTHDFWLGATVKAGPDYIVTCAPRYTETFYLGRAKYSRPSTIAKCYKRSKKYTTLKIMREIAESSRINDYYKSDEAEKNKVEKFMDSFGWSIDVSSTAESSAILIGGPAMYTGRVMVYDDPDAGPKLLTRSSKADLPKYNFGYSVASGYFFNKGILVYAVGSTYGREGAGSVHFFNKDHENLSKLDKSVDKDLVGSMFGAVLCAAKFHENGLTDLLVGAPTFAIQHYVNKGVVYVYLAGKTEKNMKKDNMEYLRKISNGKDGSYFGSAIVNLGDLNGDQSDDIAIASPYEDDGRGAVYLYSGAEIISNKDAVSYMQRIQPEGYRSFGMSLTALHDFDENGCNELAVGAPYDDAVLLYKCMTSVTVTIQTEFPTNVQNRTRENRTNFEYTVCLIVTYPVKTKEIKGDISTRVVFRHQSANLTNADRDGAFTFNISLARRLSRFCEFVGFTLPADGNYETKINIMVTSKLLIDPYSLESFDPERVVLSDRSELTKQESVWVAECSGDKECFPNLSLTFLDKTKVPYIIGSSDREEFSISVANTGDIAYDSFVLVLVFHATVRGSSQQCVPPKPTDMIPPIDGADVWVCTPKNPIKANDTWNSGPIVLYMTDLTNRDVGINIQALLFNHRKDINISNKTYEHTIDMKSDSNIIVIKGISNMGDAVNMTRNEINDGKVIEHKYTIINTGKAKWVGAKCDIILEKKPAVTYLNIEMSDIKKSYVCTKTSETSENVKTTCIVPSIERDSINIVIHIRVLSENTEVIPKEGLTVKSTIYLHLDDEVKSESVSTLVQLHEVTVPWWVILIAVLIGLFILAIIGFTLYECGFLRRAKKKELHALQKSVKRQTMRLSSVPVTDDQERMMEHVADENEATNVIENKAFGDATEHASDTDTEDNDVPKTKQHMRPHVSVTSPPP